MFDIGWSEMAVILVVALVVIGPKDLPKVARQLGKWSGKARSMAREFQRSLEDMAREAELDDIKNELQKVQRGGLAQSIRDKVDPGGEIEKAFDVSDIDRPSPKQVTASEPEVASTAPAEGPLPALAPVEPAVIEGQAEPARPEPAAPPSTSGRSEAGEEHAADAAQKS
jgi:sec-independent protein translocase protein TatB